MSATYLEIPHWAWEACVVSVCGSALWVGDRPERIGAATILGGWLATVIVSRPGWWESSAGVVVVDLIVLAALAALALRSDRYWPMWAAGFHLLAIVTHWAHSIDRTIAPWAYVTAGIIWGYLLLVALAVGTWGAWRDRRQLETSEAPAVEPGATRR